MTAPATLRRVFVGPVGIRAGWRLLLFVVLAQGVIGLPLHWFVVRGYPQFTLASGIGFWRAAALLSLLFGGLHYFLKPMEDLADFASVGLIGLFLCLTLRRTGSLWFAVGFHAGFDYAALTIVGAPNTGNGGRPISDHLLVTTFTGPDWLTGGPRGIEASLLVFPVIAALFVLFQRRYRAAGTPPSS
ncbi:MAG: hypothetical protein AUF63_00490 [Candidatus Rokubacteria bacterium 13_1_20CM_70_15]|nr:MAG: hypothetical protein AUF63_00490 [Candidatus Rokubacteria bacterium 13_1_20CM_70_15]